MKAKPKKTSTLPTAPVSASYGTARMVAKAAGLSDDALHAVNALADLLDLDPSLVPAPRSVQQSMARARGKRASTPTSASTVDAEQARRLLALAQAHAQQRQLSSAVAQQRAEIERFVRSA